MTYWWAVLFLAVFIVGIVVYFLQTRYFMKPERADEVGAAETPPDLVEPKSWKEEERKATKD